LRRGDIVSLDQADDVATGRGGVDREDGDARSVGGLDPGDDPGRVDGAENNAGVLLGDGVLHLPDLIGHAAGGRQGDGVDRDAVLRCAGLDRILHRLPEGILGKDLHVGELVGATPLHRTKHGPRVGHGAGLWRGILRQGAGPTQRRRSRNASSDDQESSSIELHRSSSIALRRS